MRVTLVLKKVWKWSGKDSSSTSITSTCKRVAFKGFSFIHSRRSGQYLSVVRPWNIIHSILELYINFLMGVFVRRDWCEGVKRFISIPESMQSISLRTLTKGKVIGLAAKDRLSMAILKWNDLNGSREPVSGIDVIPKYQVGPDDNSKLFLIRVHQML